MDADKVAAAHQRLSLRVDGLIQIGPSEALYVRPIVNEALRACREEAKNGPESKLVASTAIERIEHFLSQLTVDGRVPNPIMQSGDLRAHLLARVS